MAQDVCPHAIIDAFLEKRVLDVVPEGVHRMARRFLQAVVLKIFVDDARPAVRFVEISSDPTPRNDPFCCLERNAQQRDVSRGMALLQFPTMRSNADERDTAIYVEVIAWAGQHLRGPEPRIDQNEEGISGLFVQSFKRSWREELIRDPVAREGWARGNRIDREIEPKPCERVLEVMMPFQLSPLGYDLGEVAEILIRSFRPGLRVFNAARPPCSKC